MVAMLGMMATLIGVGIMLTGAPAFLEEWFSPWSRYLIGGFIFVAGLGISLGGLAEETRCGWFAQITGLTMMSFWSLVLGILHAALYVLAGAQWVGPGEPLSDPTIAGRAYIPLFYLSFFAISAVVLVTSAKVGRPVLAERDATMVSVNKGS